MLHDVGKMLIDPAARERYERTRDHSDPEYREHVALGHKMITGAIAPSAAGVVLHHHQHFDGSGFPAADTRDGQARGLAGEDIHVLARIVCVANHFDRLRRPADGSVQPRVRVLRAMLGTRLAARFDPIVLATLPLVVPAYPPGSIVRLSSGERAVVTDWHTEAPCQPTVQLMCDADSNDQPIDANSAREGEKIDLREASGLRVVEHDGVDVSGENFRLIQRLPEPSKNAA